MIELSSLSAGDLLVSSMSCVRGMDGYLYANTLLDPRAVGDEQVPVILVFLGIGRNLHGNEGVGFFYAARLGLTWCYDVSTVVKHCERVKEPG